MTQSITAQKRELTPKAANFPEKAFQSRFIVFEGIDGAGKTTQIQLLAENLKKLGRTVHLTAEPTVSATGGLIRDALDGLTVRTPTEMAALFLADRISHNVHPNNGISKILASGTDVICDRYYYSSLAYQGSFTDFEWVKSMNLNCPDIRRPDLCIFLDLTPQASLKRITAGRSSCEIYETEDTLAKVRKQFFDVFSVLEDKIVMINADRTPDEVADDVLSAVKELYS